MPLTSSPRAVPAPAARRPRRSPLRSLRSLDEINEMTAQQTHLNFVRHRVILDAPLGEPFYLWGDGQPVNGDDVNDDVVQFLYSNVVNTYGTCFLTAAIIYTLKAKTKWAGDYNTVAALEFKLIKEGIHISLDTKRAINEVEGRIAKCQYEHKVTHVVRGLHLSKDVKELLLSFA